MLIFLALLVAPASVVIAVVIFINGEGTPATIGGFVFLLAAIVLTYVGLHYGPQYDVWQQEMAGRAEFSRAEQNRRIQVEVAKANLESERLNAEAEVARAEGLAKANEIVIKSLGSSEAYMRYLWVQKLSPQAATVYIPTEAGLPILEASRGTQAPSR